MCGRGAATLRARKLGGQWAVGTAGTAARALQLAGRQAKTVGPSSGEGLSLSTGACWTRRRFPALGFPKAQLRRACRADQPVVRPLFRAGSTCRLAEVALLLAALWHCRCVPRQWSGRGAAASKQQAASSRAAGAGAARRVSADLVAPAALLSHAKPLPASFVRTN